MRKAQEAIAGDVKQIPALKEASAALILLGTNKHMDGELGAQFDHVSNQMALIHQTEIENVIALLIKLQNDLKGSFDSAAEVNEHHADTAEQGIDDPVLEEKFKEQLKGLKKKLKELKKPGN